MLRFVFCHRFIMIGARESENDEYAEWSPYSSIMLCRNLNAVQLVNNANCLCMKKVQGLCRLYDEIRTFTIKYF
jgi:hypothetical protein